MAENTPHSLAYTLFPWVNAKPSGFRPHLMKSGFLFLLHGAQKEQQNRADFYGQLTKSILAGRRQNWALAYHFCQETPPDALAEITEKWKALDHLENWQQHILSTQHLLQNAPADNAAGIMVGLAWDILEAYELVANAVKIKMISVSEGESWACLLAAMATKHSKSAKEFMAALMRDIHWAYQLDNVDTSLLKKNIQKIFAKAQHPFWQHSWDFNAFIGTALCGRIKQVLFAAARNVAVDTLDDFPSFEIEENLFAFLYLQNESSFGLNLLSLLNERAYFEYEKDYITPTHLFWHSMDDGQAQEVISGWLKSVVNIGDKNSLNDMHQMIMVYGQHKEMESFLYWYSQLKPEHKRKIKQNIEQDIKNASPEAQENLHKELEKLNILEQKEQFQQFSSIHFAIYDYLDDMLFWRNSFLSGYIEQEKAFAIISDLTRLICQKTKGWQDLLDKMAFICKLKLVGNTEDLSFKLAWLHVLRQNPTSPVLNHIWLQKSHKTFQETTQILLKRSHVLSNDIRLYKPSAKLWALNMAAPLMTGRQALLTAPLASPNYASENAMFLRYNLNIATAHDLDEHLDWLQSEGRRELLSSLIQEYSSYDDEEIEREIAHLENMAPDPVGDLKYRIHQLLMIKDNVEAISQCQFWALDIMRYSALVQRAVVANLMDVQTAWQHLLSAAAALQHRYNSWDDAFWDFFRAWIFDAALYPEDNEEIERRRSLIQNYLNPLSLQSFYLDKLSWYMPLGTPELSLFNDSEYSEAKPHFNKSNPTFH